MVIWTIYTCVLKQKRSTDGCLKLKSHATRQVQERLVTLEDMLSPKVGQDQVSGGVSVPCRHVTPIADAPWRSIFNDEPSSVKV